MRREVVIIGGGLAGLTASLTLARAGVKPLLLEKSPYPRHKVCGEYVSLEVKPILEKLGAYPESLHPVRIDRLKLTTLSGQTLQTPLPLGAFSLSRHALDRFLADRARESGVEIITGASVETVVRDGNTFRIGTADGRRYETGLVLGCQGKRSSVEGSLRNKPRGHSPWLAVKQHVQYPLPANEVQLHLFKQGYCGVSQVESGAVNLCYLVHRGQLKRCGSIAALESAVLSRNPALGSILRDAERLWPKPLVISNIAFGIRSPVENGILYAGDSAGLISPLCGNGMAMAVEAGCSLAGFALNYLEGACSRRELEQHYQACWNRQFARRLRWGRALQSLFWQPLLMHTLVKWSKASPRLTRKVISFTHGQPAYVPLARFA